MAIGQFYIRSVVLVVNERKEEGRDSGVFASRQEGIVQEATIDNYLPATIPVLSGLAFNRVYNLLRR